MSANILLADDDASLRFVLSQALTKEGFQVRATGNVATLAKWVREGEGDLVVSDVYMGDECVFDALAEPSRRAASAASYRDERAIDRHHGALRSGARAPTIIFQSRSISTSSSAR
ncbi:MAG: response regulator [Terricaulis sp.]